MKKGFVLQSLICLLAVSCSVHEMETTAPVPAEDDVFYASLESYSAPDTKVYVDVNTVSDGKFLTFWDAEDKISIFNWNTQNKQYEFMGETGDNSGYFKKISEGTGTGSSANYVCAVYPYQESTLLDDSGVLNLTLPEEQTYREASFGPGANTMVSTTNGENNLLRFQNVGGYLVFKFYGGSSDNPVSISSIKLEGRNGELLSGEATMTPIIGEDPAITMAQTAGTSITLTSSKAVKLGKNANKATLFWMVVPPTEFTQGFKVTVTDKDGKIFIKETDQPLTIERNRVSTMAAVEVKPADPLDPNKVIYYTTSDKSTIIPAEGADFGANIVSNEYIDLKGVMVFDGDVTQIGSHAFEHCDKLTGITIPESVEIIGNNAFNDCENLVGITIPDGITKINDYAFAACGSFTSIVIPEGVKSIGTAAFDGCYNLTDIELPSSLEFIGVGAFGGCFKITNIVIPQQVTVIAPNAFEGCTALTSIIIPESIEIIDDAAFRYCSNLNFITVQASTPPTVTANTFEYTNNCPIYVPAEHFSDYKNDPEKGWSNYASRLHTIGSPDGQIQGHAYVDMGTGLKWATMNVGAAASEENGDLLSWSDGKAAAESWAGSWRLPTSAEWESLFDKSKYTWIWNSEKNGYTVESKILGYAGNSIFLPAAGLYDSQEPDWNIPRLGFYWSSTLGVNPVYFGFDVDDPDNPLFVNEGGSSVCMSIRPVSD